jgi:uncharacterized membrane protein
MISTTPNAAITQMARESLRGRWGLAIGACLLYMLATSVGQFIPVIGWIGAIIISGPLLLGYYSFQLRFMRQDGPDVSQVFSGFQFFSNALVAQLLVGLYVFLWSLLLIIPGIIAAYGYAMTFFVLADNPTIGATEAMEESKRMMQGNRMKLFLLTCRFIGWFILGMLTLGIGLIWVVPYMVLSLSFFYEDVRGEVV